MDQFVSYTAIGQIYSNIVHNRCYGLLTNSLGFPMILHFDYLSSKALHREGRALGQFKCSCTPDLLFQM